MDPEKEHSFGDYSLSNHHREVLLKKDDLDPEGIKRDAEIARRAQNLDARFRHLFEDIALWDEVGALDEPIRSNLKVALEETEPILFEPSYEAALDFERTQSNISSFGLALGQMLSSVYPGDPTEQTRLWWGLVVGYFGTPDTSSDPKRTPESILSTILNRYEDRSETIEATSAADVEADRLLDEFAERLLWEFRDGVNINGPEDLPPELQVLVATAIGTVNRGALREAQRRYSKYNEQSGGAEFFLESEFAAGIERIVDRHIDTELLSDLNTLVRCLVRDGKRVLNAKKFGVQAVDVFHCLWESEEPLSSTEMKSRLRKGGASQFGKLANDLAGEGTSDYEWAGKPPGAKTNNQYELTPYGELLGFALFESSSPFSQIFAIGLSTELQELFDVTNGLPSLIEETLSRQLHGVEIEDMGTEIEHLWQVKIFEKE